MIYQPLLSNSNPYIVRKSCISSFAAHLHHELEILYCIEGHIDLILNGIKYELFPGDAAIIGSMVAHEIIHKKKSGVFLVIEFGPLFLKENFKYISHISFEYPIIRTTIQESTFCRDFAAVLERLVELCDTADIASNLSTTGNLYQLSSYIISHYGNSEDLKQSSNTLRIENVLELIYYQYQTPITIEDAAKVSGYSKSNFCRNFKLATGMSFHCYLTQYRISSSYYLLRNTDYPITAIAENVGFNDTRSFCRAFKSITGITATQYRTEHNYT